MRRLAAAAVLLGVLVAPAQASMTGCKVAPNTHYQHVDARPWQWTALVPGGALGTGFAWTPEQGERVCGHALSHWVTP